MPLSTYYITLLLVVTRYEVNAHVLISLGMVLQVMHNSLSVVCNNPSFLKMSSSVAEV